MVVQGVLVGDVRLRIGDQTPPDTAIADAGIAVFAGTTRVFEVAGADEAGFPVYCWILGPVVRRHFVEFQIIELVGPVLVVKASFGIPCIGLVRGLDFSCFVERFPSFLSNRI